MVRNNFKVDILSVDSVEQLKNQLIAYNNEIQKKTDLFVMKLAELGIPIIEQKMSEASFTVDSKGISSGSDTSHNTYVKLTKLIGYSKATLTVDGKELLFIEFGSGVHYNGSSGKSPHPKGEELGYTIGSYGDGHGKQDTWGYIDESGDLVITHGTKATMPLHSAYIEIVKQYIRIGKEVFGS